MFIFNVLPLREFCSPKSQFAKYQCLCIINVLSCIINVFFPGKGREALRQSLTAFRCLTIGRELSEIPANQAEFAPFVHKFCKLCEFCTKIHPHLVHYFQNHQQRTPEN